MKPFYENYDLPCSGCSNEPIEKIPLFRIIETLDSDYAKNDLVSATRHLQYWRREAMMLGDMRSELSLCNEMIGLCRRTNDIEEANAVISRADFLIDKLRIENTASAGTVYLNMATTLKHFGDSEKALLFYEKTERIYQTTLPQNAYEYAALFNNKAAVLEELGRYEEAFILLHKALETLDLLSCHRIDKAISYVNLARLLFVWKEDTDAVDRYLALAWETVCESGISHDGAYAFVCAKASEVFAYFGRDDEALALSEVAREIYEGA